MGVENHPVFVDDFLARADEANLQFISEANMAASRVENYSPEARRQLSLIKNIVQRDTDCHTLNIEYVSEIYQLLVVLDWSTTIAAGPSARTPLA